LPNLDFAASVFAALDSATRDGVGIVRDSYGPGEQAAHDILRLAAERMRLRCPVDAIGNLFMTLPGENRTLPELIIGSHLDSVPQGGNFDGAAGVVAGLAALGTLQSQRIALRHDVTVMAIRAEESAWFDIPYLGSAGAFGLLDPAVLEICRSDNGMPLAQVITLAGFDVEPIKTRHALLDAAKIRAYVELHIEQGPELVGEARALAVVSGIRGCLRFRTSRCLGRYGHSGAVGRRHRADSVAATVALLHHMNVYWQDIEASGADLVLTCGEIFTNPVLQGPSKIAGEVSFAVDIRSTSDQVMQDAASELRRAAGAIAAAHHVHFDLGSVSYSPPAAMDMRLRERLLALSTAPYEMASGAGHDAAIFAKLGIPSAMIFVRNHNGSHNPDEAMDLVDFAEATALLTRLLVDFPL
jgi:N-carbamoyl-L-amino-acid hydrolase